MTVVESIKAELLTARKARDAASVTALTTLLGEIVSIGKTKDNRETTDEEAVKVVKKFTENVNETLKLITDSTVKANLEKELQIYAKFTPSQLTEAELTTIINQIISKADASLGKSLIGFIMKELNANYSGRFDGKTANTIIRSVMQ